MRNLILTLGDQLDRRSAAFDGFDPVRDAVWMAETAEESTHVWCHKLRLVFFFSAMRHFRDDARRNGDTVHYHRLTADPAADDGDDFSDVLIRFVSGLKKFDRPERLIVLEPGDFRVRRLLGRAAAALDIPLEVRADRHFYVTPGEFADWAAGKKSLLLENFYRTLRKRERILLEDDGEPVGGAWNFDKENRAAYPKGGPPAVARPRAFTPDAVTRDVIALVEKRFADHPGGTDTFDLPVTRADAAALCDDFVEHRLPTFGLYQDALWTGEDFGSHSRLSAAMNLHLLDPRQVIEKAVTAYHSGHAPLPAVEGFVRQVLGWREYVRGIYWLHMPEYAERNALDAELPVPQFFWDGQTDMACVADAMRNVLRHGYAHHIQRLMVLGLFAQLAGVNPLAFHEWHMAMYCDAVDWVSLPNTLGMSQWGDGGVVGSKPYCASGNYIKKQSNGSYCKECRYDPKKAVGEDACPFTTLYWDFLDRNKTKFASNRRMGLQIKNVERKKPDELRAIRERADELKRNLEAKERF